MTLGTFGSLFLRAASTRPPSARLEFLPARPERSGRCWKTSYEKVQNGTIPVFGLITAQTQPQAGGGIDIMTILLFAMLGVFIFMMFRRNKKTQQTQAQLQSKFAPGVEVMTSFGLYGRIVEIDEEENKVLLELSPGNTATVHRQAVTKIVEPVVAAEPEAADAPVVVPNDASSLSIDKTDGAAPVSEAPIAETPEETLRRLNNEGKKDS
jgi:preprotein translocase subunit YajC